MRAVTLSFAILFLAGAVATAGDEPLTKFEKLPADVEVHVVAVYEPRYRGVAREEITDWQGLVKALRAKDGASAHIRKFLPRLTNMVLTEDIEMGRLGDETPRTVAWHLARGLGQAMQDNAFYDKDVFAKVELPKAVKELVDLGEKRTVYQNERLNRDLLALAFPKHIPPTPDDFHTVHVTVKPGKPVVLVTSSYYQCRWKVTVEKGATLAGVVQFGNAAQELLGADAPVVYRAGRWPNGKQGPTRGFNAHKEQDEPSYNRMKAEVKEATGKDFANFQGQYDSRNGPFVVKPGAK